MCVNALYMILLKLQFLCFFIIIYLQHAPLHIVSLRALCSFTSVQLL